jgi:5-methylcytosine-specific restriction endonuclease McrA
MPIKDPEARRAYMTAWRASHPEQTREHARAGQLRYRAKHPERLRVNTRARTARYRARHPEKGRARRAANPEHVRAIEAASRARYPERKRARDAAWQTNNPDKAAAKAKRYRLSHRKEWSLLQSARYARKRGALVDDFSAAQWREMQAAYEHRCVYCDRLAKGHLTQDHITPVGPEGGHTLWNIVPACNRCNSRKQAGPVLCPVQPLMLTLAPAKRSRARSSTRQCGLDPAPQ